MASAVDMTQAEGFFKKAYPKTKLDTLVPDYTYFSKEAEEVPAASKTGGTFTQPVTLSSEQGVTFAAAEAGVYDLNAPIALSTKNAEIAGSNCTIRSAISLEAIKRSNSVNAFQRVSVGTVENMQKSSYNYMEASIMWGQSGLGTVESEAGSVVTITTAEMAPGLWFGSEGRKIAFFTAAGLFRVNMTVSTYDVASRTVTFTTDVGAAGIVAGDIMYFDNSGDVSNEMVGLYKAFTNTTGTIWGISSTTYALWRPNTAYGVGGLPLSFAHIMKAIAQAYSRGLGSDIREIDVVLHPMAWQNVANDSSAIRRTDSSYSGAKFQNGTEVLEFFSQAGIVRVMSHQMMKEGYAFILPRCSRSLMKVGAETSPTFVDLGMGKGDGSVMMRVLENSNGVELRNYWNMAIFSKFISQFQLISGIVNA